MWGERSGDIARLRNTDHILIEAPTCTFADVGLMVEENVRLGIVSELGAKFRRYLLVSGRRVRSAPYSNHQYLEILILNS
jgi:hypothetical protein